jgi:hypothetical protein
MLFYEAYIAVAAAHMPESRTGLESFDMAKRIFGDGKSDRRALDAF